MPQRARGQAGAHDARPCGATGPGFENRHDTAAGRAARNTRFPRVPGRPMQKCRSDEAEPAQLPVILLLKQACNAPSEGEPETWPAANQRPLPKTVSRCQAPCRLFCFCHVTSDKQTDSGEIALAS